MTNTFLLLWKNTPNYQRTFDKIFSILRSKYQYLFKSTICFFPQQIFQNSPATGFSLESCVSWRKRRGMAHNVPRVADVPRKGYKINRDKKVSPRAACGNAENDSLIKVNLLIFIIISLFKPNIGMTERLTACYVPCRLYCSISLHFSINKNISC